MKKTSVVICAVLGFVISFFAVVFPVRAATVNVSTGAGFTSAVAAASSGDTINITQDITITAEVSVFRSLTINGNGHVLSVPVPGLNDSGVYNTNPSLFRALTTAISGGTIAINDLTIKGGKSVNAAAGVLNTNGTRLVLTRVNISNALCDESGGGLYNDGGTVYLINSSISRNASGNGGGFRNNNLGAIRGTMYIENSTISENRSISSNGGGGAGENNGDLYVNNSTFANNKSTELGGAINNNNGTLYVLNSTFTGNVAYNPTFRGGAIALNRGTATLINTVFAFNYRNSGSTVTPAYAANDVYLYPDSLGAKATAYKCIFQAPDDASVTFDASNITYTGLLDGSDDTIFSGGSTTRVLGPNGAELGTATVYQPFLIKADGAYVPTAALKTGSFVIGKGVRTGFSNVYASTVVGYYNGSSWVDLVGSGAGSFEVLVDQNDVTRASTPAIGALESAIGTLHMLKVNSATGGIVSGGSVYGDAYPSGTSVTLIALPSNGYSFTRWDYVLGGTGIASTSNPYPLTLSQNTTLLPVFTEITGYAITYIGNGNTGGTAPAQQTAEADATTTISGRNTLTKNGYQFSRWNTKTDGSGTDYAVGSTYASNSTNLVLYAQYQFPAAPSGVTATVTSPTDITLNWTDNSANETGFIPGSSPDNATFTNLASTASTSQSFTGLSANTRYWFHVAATNSAGNSDYTSTSGKYTFATPPTATSAIANDSTSITVSWSGGAASMYQVSYAGGNSGWIAANSYRFNGLSCNTAYTFILSGRNGDDIETDPISVLQSTPDCASAYVPLSKPDVSNLKINVSSGGSVNLDNLPSDVVQIAVSTNSNFDGVSWENIFDKDKLFQKYAGASDLYLRFRDLAGGVSDMFVYHISSGAATFQTLNEGDIVKTADNFDVYIIKYMNGKQYKRLILSPSVFNSYQHLKWENIKVISQAQMDQYVTSILAQETNDTVIYELTPLGDTGRKEPLSISSYDSDSVYEINKEDRDSYVMEK